MKLRRTIYFLFILIIFQFNIGLAGYISSDLEETILKAEPSKKLRILIYPENRLPAPSLKKELATEYKSNAERHLVGISRLKQTAAISQASLIEYLKQLEISGLARNIKGHWILNVISAEVTVSELEILAARNDVYEISQMPKIELIKPTKTSSNPMLKTSTGIESNLVDVGADLAWQNGYTGQGRIICSFDTGVDGLHPALCNNWKGHDGDSTAAWFDPFGGEPFPHTFPEAGGGEPHGTHTMGIMIGHASSTGDTIGVAPDAKWISAAVIDLPYASIIDAFEWAADPDGDPNTFDDVPDVINHSWGIPNSAVGCHEYFWEMIDNSEALGIVNIFAAGNEGYHSMTIRNPANRAFDSLDCFAVGNFWSSQNRVHDESSRGPSDCDGVSIKPNAVAPGVSIRSSFPDGKYVSRSGTSMSAPHVSGAVAILRQYAPNATPDQIKEALLAGCVRYPQPDSDPNNAYGWGLINIPRAIDFLAPLYETNLRIYSFNSPAVNPGETASGFVVVKNLGHTIDNIYGEVTGANNALTVLTGTLNFGTIELNDTACSDMEFIVEVDDTVTPGRILAVDFTLFGDGGYAKPTKLYIRVGESPSGGLAGFHTHTTDRLAFTVSNFGQYGFGDGSILPIGYGGFDYNDEGNDLYEAAFLIATDADHVSDGASNSIQEPDNDFAVSPEGDMVTVIPGQNADQETFSRFNDSYAENPIGLEIEKKTYSWNSYPDDNFIIMEYTIKNNTEFSIGNIYVGLFFNWDIDTYWSNCGGFYETGNLGHMFYLNGGDSSNFRGLTVINLEGVKSYSLWANPYPLSWEESDKYLSLSDGIIDISFPGKNDISLIMSTGPFFLLPDQTDTAVFAVVAADNLGELISTTMQARTKYDETTEVEFVDYDNLPENFSLSQNYPNPFNPVTSISFNLKSRARAKLSIYNILGEKIIDLVDETLSAGNYKTSWDCRNKNGRKVTSGIYLYRLSVNGCNLTRKMTLIK